ncbi:hypothetical protein [Actinoplanes sp. NPDC026670]|uniref:hypothetical protein n=1 Tax=Actinoplanes sp. NPDC026670 TaxID=3154700 RepID=UPI0033C5D121
MTQFNLLDTAAAFTVVFWALAVLSAPVIFTGGWWALLPVGLLIGGLFSYAGALVTARQHGTLLATAYDLHRFDMLRNLHVALPKTPEQERTTNQRVSRFLRYGRPYLTGLDYDENGKIAIKYEHPEPDTTSPSPASEPTSSN